MRGDYAPTTKQGPETTLRELHPRNRGDMEPRNAMWPSVTLAAHMSAPAFQTGCLPACLPAWLPGCFFASTLRFVSVRPIVRLPSPLPRVQVVLPLLRNLAWKGTARRIFDDPDNGLVHRGFNVDFFGRPRRSGTIDCYKVMRRDFTYEDFRQHPSL